MFLEYWMIATFVVAAAFFTWRSYKIGRLEGLKKGLEVTTVSVDVAFNTIMDQLQQDNVIRMSKDEDGRERAYPGNIDLTALDRIYDKIDDPAIISELRKSLSTEIR